MITDDKRVVITGVGVVSPIGIGNGPFWSSLLNGRSGVGYLRSVSPAILPSKFGAEIHDFDPVKYIYCRRFIKVMSREIQLGVSAASLAMQDSGLKRGSIDPNRLGVDFGAGRIAIRPEDLGDAVDRLQGDASSSELTRWGEDGMGKIAPLWLLKRMPSMPACHVSIEHDARGPNNTITSRDASALLALAEAVRDIERDAADCMIVGACGSNVHAIDIAKMNLFEGLSQRSDDPQRACRPFDKNRDGTILGEGAAAFIVERYEHAVRRGADIYAEVIGVGAGCDGRGYENGARGTGLVRAMQAALKRAELNPNQIGHINAHGKSTQRDDLVEANAYHRAFGDVAGQIPVTALKSYFGNSDAGSGAVELAGTVLGLRHGLIPATLNYEIPDPSCRLNVVHAGPQSLKNRTAISVNRTRVGQSAAAILRAI
jgi:3-oxoacyl-[acyl-carrier-protein] synthase II